MKRNISLSLVLAILLALLVPTVSLAANVTSYTSGFQVQNLNSTVAAAISIDFFNRSDGSKAATQTATVPAGGSSTFFPLAAVSAGFDGSAVIASDQPVAAIVNILGNNGQQAAAYDGFSSGATTAYIPLVQKANYGTNSFFNVQNVGSSDASVTVSYPGTSCTETATIKAGAASRFDQATNACLPNGARSAVVTSTGTSPQPIVATVIQVQSDTQYSKAAILAYNAFANTGSTNPIMPLVSSGWYGSITGIQIQNTGGTNTDVTVTYTPAAGFPGASCTETKTIPAGQSMTFGLSTGNLLPSTCRTVQGTQTAFVGSARITTNSTSQNLVAIVNQISSTSATSAAYSAFNPSSGTTTVSLPLIADRNYGIFSGFSVANVGGSTATITCTFTNSSYTASADVAPGGTLTTVQKGVIADKYVGSATCTSTVPLVAVVNYLDPGTTTGALDGLSVYEGINR